MTTPSRQATDVGEVSASTNQSLHVGHRQRDDLPGCPAIPYWADDYKVPPTPNEEHINDTLARLGGRAQQTEVAKRGLSRKYTIANQQHSAYWFLYGTTPSMSEQLEAARSDLDAARRAPLEDAAPSQQKESLSAPLDLPLAQANQFTLPWTNYAGIYDSSKDLIATFSEWLKHGGKATEQFWPTIARFGLPYNLLIPKKIKPGEYVIDMSIIASLPGASRTLPGTGTEEVRFTPGTRTVLQQTPSKWLIPTKIEIFTQNGPTQTYKPTDNAWLYALQAAKSSITVYGTWLGHVYQWHIVTAAMQMTMYNSLPENHDLLPLLLPQSEFLIDFDYVLLEKLWDVIAPPTPVGDGETLLKLFNQFGANRGFFDDDPYEALKNLGVSEEDFTLKDGWDRYPLVRVLLAIWDFTHDYVETVVAQIYENDNEVRNDAALQKWMAESRDKTQGNIKGLPPVVNTRETLIEVLTSLLHRVTAHGVARLNPSVNPALAFIANFPPCLQSGEIPAPGNKVTEKRLLEILPHTRTLGGMTSFYYTFAFSVPYIPLIPLDGVRADPPFSNKICNEALFTYRESMMKLMDSYVAEWKKALIELGDQDPGIPTYARYLHHQWPRNIET